MTKSSLYVICRDSIEALEAWDPNDVEPTIVFGPASLTFCQYETSVRFSSPEYYIAKYNEK